MSDIKRFEPLWGVWRTVEPLGEGSFGKVYKAVREDFGRSYYAAVKHIPIPANEAQIRAAISEGVGSTEEELRTYFERTAQSFIDEIYLMNEVKGNTNIVSYEDHLVLPKENGIGCDIFIRMELLTGLEDLLRSRRLTREEVIRLGIDICTALEVCADKNIIHRDIKPSNIFVGARGEYKLGDFGVARQLSHTTGGMSKKGTFSYMAPEIYRGETANRTVDVYSLGIVMYRLLNGSRAPFLRADSGALTPGDNEAALTRRMSGEPLPPPAYADPALAAVILTATQFDRRMRYDAPGAMKNALMWVLEGKAGSARSSAKAEPTFTAASRTEATAGTAVMTKDTAAAQEEYEATVGLEETAAMTEEGVAPEEAARWGADTRHIKLALAVVLIVIAIVSVSLFGKGTLLYGIGGKGCADKSERTTGEALSDGDLLVDDGSVGLISPGDIAASWSDAVTSSDIIAIPPPTTTTTTTTTATIAIGGSVKLQAEVLEAAAKANNFGNYLSDMNGVMMADVSIVNLLGSIGDGDAKAYPNGSYPAALAKALGEININSVVTAKRPGADTRRAGVRRLHRRPLPRGHRQPRRPDRGEYRLQRAGDKRHQDRYGCLQLRDKEGA